MSHLLPSISLRGGFLVRILSGFGFLPGMGDLPRSDVCDEERLGAEGVIEEARSDGFLCVISVLSTFRRPEVTDSPRDS